jgi:CubicO group peptidase (beta-lactamase class C family)
MGFMMSTDNRQSDGDSLILGETAFGHVGMGGSVGFADPAQGDAVKIGVLMGSIASALCGYTLLRFGAARRQD